MPKYPDTADPFALASYSSKKRKVPPKDKETPGRKVQDVESPPQKKSRTGFGSRSKTTSAFVPAQPTGSTSETQTS